MVIATGGVALDRDFGSERQIDDEWRVVRGPLVGARRSVHPHVDGDVGDGRRAECEVDAKPVVLVEL
ncbi:MAG: hypothetical protein EBY61_09825, partial [Actinobacteria bacterium]|nr:hypothetical protein [Actinomycetota bacterium]